MSCCVLVAEADPRFFGLATYDERLAGLDLHRLLNADWFAGFRLLREADSASYVGMAIGKNSVWGTATELALKAQKQAQRIKLT